jgi:hypothetical protein
MARLDDVQPAVGSWRQRRVLVGADQQFRVTGGVQHGAPRVTDLSGCAGLLRQRLRS